VKAIKLGIIRTYDVVIACLSVPLALGLRLGRSVTDVDPIMLVKMALIFGVIFAAAYVAFGIHRFVFRYISTYEMMAIAKVVTLSILVFLLVLHLLEFVEFVPRSFSGIQWFLLFGLICAPRFLARALVIRRNRIQPPDRAIVPVLVISAGDSAEHFIRAVNGSFKNTYEVVGLIDDEFQIKGRWIHGVPVLGHSDELNEIVLKLASQGKRPQRILICDDKFEMSRETKTELFERASALGLKVARLTGPAEFQDGDDPSMPKLNPIALEDLLGRPQADLDRAAVDRLIHDKTVLITGAGGTIGSELARQIAKLEPKRLILVEFSEWNLYSIDIELAETLSKDVLQPVICNIRDRKRLMQVFEEHRPDLVFHAAALKHVPMVELNPAEGVLSNVMGSKNVADAAHRFGARAFVQVSTDKAVNPTSLMGASKRLAEFYCQALDLASEPDAETDCLPPRFMTVRFGNVLGSSGSVVPLFQKQLAKGGPLTVTHPDMQRYFMTVREAVELVLQAAAHGVRHDEERGKILVLDMGDPIKIADVAKQMIRLAGLRPGVDVDIAFTGLRPGEKLFEELFDETEQRADSTLKGILVARSQPIEQKLLNRVFGELFQAAERNDTTTIKRLIKHVLSSYGERNSTAA
jgi:O-antigen biosynthesis protein WbqV